MTIETTAGAFPVIRDLRDFDRNSGNRLERLVFNHRGIVLVLCLAMTAVMGFFASQLRLQASFDAMLPVSHPYIRNYLENRAELSSLGNSVRVIVETRDGNIYDKDYLEVVKQINDHLFLTPGVDRAFMRSLWTPIVRWTEITEEGFVAGPVMPFDYDASPASVQQLQTNVGKARLVGDLVGNDLKSSMIFVPLLDKIAATGEPLDYNELARVLEEDIRAKFETPDGRYRVRVIGFAQLVGDLIAGMTQVMAFFGIAAFIAACVIFVFTRDLRSTLLLVISAACGVVWLLGLLRVLGYDLNPYSILVPFLIFAIGLSHGAQKMNGIMLDVGHGIHKYVAARYTFRRLFVAGITALLTNVVGFAVLMIIDIPVIRDLALTTSIGVLILIVTKLVFIPVALSYIGVSEKAARRAVARTSEDGSNDGVVMRMLVRCTERRAALPIVVVSLAIGVAAAYISLTHLKIGDLDPGAPELRPDSRYNLDVAYVNEHYTQSSDQFAVIVKTPVEGMRQHISLVEQDRLAWQLEQLPAVLATSSVAGGIRMAASGSYEGNPKWTTLLRNTAAVSNVTQNLLNRQPELMNQSATVAPVIAYLRDHRADTLTEVVRTVEEFAAQHDTDDRKFLLAAGTAGIEAATNIVVKQANYRILGLLYLAVAVLCYFTFRSWRAVVVAMVPLVITSFLCETLMVVLGIGVKVATLPVIALGVGVGVDYALYLLTVQLALMRAGIPLAEAYRRSLNFTGRVVGLIGLTMAAGVFTWVWSPIKFQGDMGLLLTFMFLWNMVGALVLIPALSRFLLVPKEPKPVTASTQLAAH